MGADDRADAALADLAGVVGGQEVDQLAGVVGVAGHHPEGLDVGAVDFLPKPFRFAELVARLQALARRNGVARATVLQRGDVELDPARRTATRDGRDLELGPKAFGDLEALLAADGAVVSPEELLQRVWDEHADPFTNAVRMVVMTLRRKLGDPPVIHTVQGSGYRV